MPILALMNELKTIPFVVAIGVSLAAFPAIAHKTPSPEKGETHAKFRLRWETVGLKPSDSIYCDVSRHYRVTQGQQEIDLSTFTGTGRRHWFRLYLIQDHQFAGEIRIVGPGEPEHSVRKMNTEMEPGTEVKADISNPGAGGGRFLLTVMFEGFSKGGGEKIHRGDKNTCHKVEF